MVKSIAESFPNYKNIGCYYHYCKTILVYAKNHQCYTKLTTQEIIFLLFAYKIYPFIKDKKEYIKKIGFKNQNIK